MGVLKIKNNGSWLNVISDYAARAIVAAHNLASNAHADQFNDKQNKTDNSLSNLDEQGRVVQSILAVDNKVVLPKAKVTISSGSTVTATQGSRVVTATSVDGYAMLTLTNIGEWSIVATLGGQTSNAVTINVNNLSEYRVALHYNAIYGVQWSKSSNPVWSRTDDSALFTNPVPYVLNATSYGSPFDNLYPWSGMVIEERGVGTMVKIPKYYYKWTDASGSLKLQIADHAEEGYHCSPAHAPRFSGDTEKDYVYVGRYHCSTNYKSESNATPIASITRATARTNIHAKGQNVWQYDFAMFWTIAMLYLVEFGNWDSQATIGYGCGNGTAKEACGASDTMPYHTGTMKANRTTYGVGVQYRYIEGLWDNCYDWCDGIYFSGADVYCINNPSLFSDTTNGTLVGSRHTANGYQTAMFVPTVSGYEYALYCSEVGGSATTYICDYAYQGGVVLCVGGDYGQHLYLGLFYFFGYYSASNAGAGIGCRLQEIP